MRFILCGTMVAALTCVSSCGSSEIDAQINGQGDGLVYNDKSLTAAITIGCSRYGDREVNIWTDNGPKPTRVHVLLPAGVQGYPQLAPLPQGAYLSSERDVDLIVDATIAHEPIAMTIDFSDGKVEEYILAPTAPDSRNVFVSCTR